MKRILALSAALACALSGLSAQTVDAFLPLSARMAALGGPHAASASGLDALFENPAGFAADEEYLSVSSVVVHPAGPVFDLASLMVSGGASGLVSGLSSLLDAKGRLYVDLDLLGPLAFGFVGKGLGFGIYNRTQATINAASLFSASLSLTEEAFLAGGYAHRFTLGDGSTLDAGIMPKGFVKAGVSLSGSLADLMAVVAVPDALLSGCPFVVTSGLGLDAGVKWTKGGFAAALVGRDAFSPALVTMYTSFNDFTASPSTSKVGASETVLVPADLSLGVAYEPSFPLLERLGADVLILADYRDLLDLFADIPRNPILNASLGLELTLLDILSLRAGLYDALPSAGFGIDLTFCTFSLAMYGKELGLDPGVRPVYNLIVALDFVY